VIGWAMDDHLRAELVLAAVTMGVVLRGQLAKHADRGCQYTSEQLPRFTGEHNLIRSVGRTGVCWDCCG
jgi:transposase InsO family protein